MSDTIPAWLSSKIDQRLALINERAVPDIAAMSVAPNIIVTPLSEPRPGASKLELVRWERTCDCCGIFCDNDKPFYTGQATRDTKAGVQVIMFFGVCEEHRYGG